MENISPMPFNSRKLKNWIDFLYSFIFLILPNRKKISNRETGKYVYLHKVEKMEQFSLFFYVFSFISTKWKAFHCCHLFPRNAKKVKLLSLFLYTYFFSFSQSGLHFTNAIYFHEVENVSSMHCISLK